MTDLKTEHPEFEDYGDELEAQFLVSDEGSVAIGDDVIARIVEPAASEVEGVEIDSKVALSDTLSDILGRKKEGERREHIKGIGVQRDPEDHSVNIIMSVRMAYGEDMYDLAIRLRKHIRATVEKMTHVKVSRVDIRIVGITTKKTEQKAKEGQREQAPELLEEKND